MPIYEYRCQHCGYEFEAIRKLTDGPLTECPECGASGLKKLISAAGFRLKGGGWYETDFKKGNKKNLAEAQDPAKKQSQSDKDSKPAASKASTGQSGG